MCNPSRTVRPTIGGELPLPGHRRDRRFAKLSRMLLALVPQVDTVGHRIPVIRNGKEMLESEGI